MRFLKIAYEALYSLSFGRYVGFSELIETKTFNQGVEGSNPSGPTNQS